jgi:hypothetical protein
MRLSRSFGTRHLQLDSIRNHSTRRSSTNLTVGLSLHQSHKYHDAPDQIEWRFAVGKRFDDLLCNPSGCWVIGHIEVEHFPAVMLQYEEHKQDSQSDCRKGKEVHRHDLAKMIAKKRFQV